MKIFKTMALGATILALTACNQGGTSISGEATGVDKLTLMRVQEETTDTIGDITVKDQKFNYDLEIDTTRLYFLQAGELTVPLFVQPGEKVELTIKAGGSEANYVVSGSPESERVKQVTTILDSTIADIDRLNTKASELQAGEGSAAAKMKLDSSFQAVVEGTKQNYVAFIDQEPGSLANIFVLSQRVGNMPLYDLQGNFEQVERMASAMVERYPGHPITSDFDRKVKEMKPQIEQARKREQRAASVVAGKPAPELALPSPSGDVIKLSDLRGKVVLVDFWAAWCRPCRMENPNLVKTYNEFHDQGFEVLSVSIDGLPQQQDPKGAWLQAIEEDGLRWDTHVSDLRGWQSQAVQEYGFQGIPYTVLIDREGNIIATNLRGSDLRNKLAEVMNTES